MPSEDKKLWYNLPRPKYKLKFLLILADLLENKMYFMVALKN